MFSTASNYDYFRINDAKWNVLNDLTNKKLVLPQTIDGGFEFNGWYLSESINYDPSNEGRWWWIAKVIKLKRGYLLKIVFLIHLMNCMF